MICRQSLEKGEKIRGFDYLFQPPMPRCRGYCMLSIMAAFCKPPAVLNYHTVCNKDSTICCDNSK